jgi:FAD/FMN-containing dehydrogenase
MVNLRSSSTISGTVDDVAVRELASSLRGQLLRPGDAGYEAARRVFNAMIDRHPALILRCLDAEDVARGVEVARTQGLPLAVRGGGIVLDMSRMKGIRVDPARRIAVAQPGLTLGEFDRATQAHGLATTLGVVSVTGIAGLTLGGGLGWLNGKHGLACDNLLAAEVVVADGRRLTATAIEHADLLWGSRAAAATSASSPPSHTSCTRSGRSSPAWSPSPEMPDHISPK